MEIILLILRVLMITIATLATLIYVFWQLFQHVPTPDFRLKTYDFVLLAIVAFLFAVGFDAYWGLLLIVPMVAWKFLALKLFRKSRLGGSGRWIELEWRKMTPKGFALPKEMMNEMGKLPGDKHLLIPRLITMFGMKWIQKNVGKSAKNIPAKMKGQEAQALGMIEKMMLDIKKLESGKSETMSFPFGVLKITRL